MLQLTIKLIKGLVIPLQYILFLVIKITIPVVIHIQCAKHTFTFIMSSEKVLSSASASAFAPLASPHVEVCKGINGLDSSAEVSKILP